MLLYRRVPYSPDWAVIQGQVCSMGNLINGLGHHAGMYQIIQSFTISPVLGFFFGPFLVVVGLLTVRGFW